MSTYHQKSSNINYLAFATKTLVKIDHAEVLGNNSVAKRAISQYDVEETLGRHDAKIGKGPSKHDKYGGIDFTSSIYLI